MSVINKSKRFTRCIIVIFNKTNKPTDVIEANTLTKTKAL